MKHEGNLFVNRSNVEYARKLTEITRCLFVDVPNVTFQCLKIIRGDLYVQADNASFPLLERVEWDLSINSPGAELQSLTDVGWSLYVAGPKAKLPSLLRVGQGLHIRSDGFSLPRLATVGHGLDLADGIFFDATAIKFGQPKPVPEDDYSVSEKHGLFRAGWRGPWTQKEGLRAADGSPPASIEAIGFKDTVIS